jgi:hypothetical protein
MSNFKSMNVCNEMECFSLANISSLAYSLLLVNGWSLSRVKHFSSVQLHGRSLALATNIRLGGKGLPGNTLAY